MRKHFAWNPRLFLGTHDFLFGTHDFFLRTHDFFLGTHDFFLGTHDFLPTTHDFLPTTHDFLPTTHDFLPTTHDFLPTTHDILPTTHDPRLLASPFRTVYITCHTRITQFLGNIWCSSVYEITDLVFALVSGFLFAFIGFIFLFLAGGGQLSQSYLKLFVFDSSSCAGTVALFWSFRGVPLGFISFFIFSLATR